MRAFVVQEAIRTGPGHEYPTAISPRSSSQSGRGQSRMDELTDKEARLLLRRTKRALTERGDADFAARLLEHVDEEEVRQIFNRAARQVAEEHLDDFLDAFADHLCLAATGSAVPLVREP